MNGRWLLIKLVLCLCMLLPSAPVLATPLGRLFSLASERQKLDALRITSKHTPAIKQKSSSTLASPSFQAKLGKDEDDASLADNDEKDGGLEESGEITDDDQ
jgi:hypothetical protein